MFLLDARKYNHNYLQALLGHAIFLLNNIFCFYILSSNIL